MLKYILFIFIYLFIYFVFFKPALLAINRNSQTIYFFLFFFVQMEQLHGDTKDLVSCFIADRDKCGTDLEAAWFWDSDNLLECPQIEKYWDKYVKARNKIIDAFGYYKVEIINRLGSLVSPNVVFFL